MAEILDQNEIEALLSAVDEGEIREESAAGQLFTRHRRDLESIEIRPYDFQRPERVSKEQMMALQTLHEAFARVFGASLSGFLRTIVEVKVASAEQMTYGEFIASLPNPTAFSLVHPTGLDGTLCLEISPLIVYPVIDRLLGGSSSEVFIPQRPMTAIEARLAGVILERAMTGLSEAWSGICKVTFTRGEMESNPQLVQIVPPNEVVIVIGFEIKVGSRAGTMDLCIPFNVIEPLMEEISAQSWFNNKRGSGDPQCRLRLGESLAGAPVTVSGVLAETQITLQELSSLSPGDIIVTEREATRPIVLCIEGERKFLGHLGQFRGNRAIRIDRPVTRADRL